MNIFLKVTGHSDITSICLTENVLTIQDFIDTLNNSYPILKDYTLRIVFKGKILSNLSMETKLETLGIKKGVKLFIVPSKTISETMTTQNTDNEKPIDTEGQDLVKNLMSKKADINDMSSLPLFFTPEILKDFLTGSNNSPLYSTNHIDIDIDDKEIMKDLNVKSSKSKYPVDLSNILQNIDLSSLLDGDENGGLPAFIAEHGIDNLTIEDVQFEDEDGNEIPQNFYEEEGEMPEDEKNRLIEEYSSQLAQLRELGFVDDDMNLIALKLTNGNVELAINFLIDG